jgi:predicted S18 family serine protease
MQQAESSHSRGGISLSAADLRAPCYAGSWLFALSGKRIKYDNKNQV